MQWFYLAFNMCVVGGAVFGTWRWAPRFWGLWRRIITALATVSLGWIILDIISVDAGWWSYNAAYVFNIRVAGLPFEELLFFVSVPIACMALGYLFARWPQPVSAAAVRYRLLVLALISGTLLWVKPEGDRTVLDCLLALATLGMLARSKLAGIRGFWLWNVLICCLCLVFNTLLTALPVVVYNEAAMTGWRIGTIPVEDFIYNFSLLNMWALVVLHGFPRTEPSGGRTTQHAQNCQNK